MDTGNFFLRGKADSGNNIYEQDQEGNNIDYWNIFIRRPANSDLTITNIDIDKKMAAVGDTLKATWFTRNNAQATASGKMTEIVYLSQDTIVSNDDLRFTKGAKEIFLPGLTQEKDSLSFVVPPLPQNTYHVLVATDVLNNIPDSVRTNNVGFTPNPIAITLESLPINDSINTVLAHETFHYFRIEVPDDLIGKTLSVSFSTDRVDAGNELYIRYENLPDRVNNDYSQDDPTKASQEVLIPSMQSGTYYVLLTGTNPNRTSQSVWIATQVLPFELYSVEAKQGGNSRTVTVLLEGSQLTQDTEVSLVRDDAAPIPAIQIEY